MALTMSANRISKIIEQRHHFRVYDYVAPHRARKLDIEIGSHSRRRGIVPSLSTCSGVPLASCPLHYRLVSLSRQNKLAD